VNTIIEPDIVTPEDHEIVLQVDDHRGSGLFAIIAVHDTRRGRAIGGLRVSDYPDRAAALRDVLRLSAAMTAKTAIVGIVTR